MWAALLLWRLLAAVLELPELGIFGKDVKSPDRSNHQATRAFSPSPLRRNMRQKRATGCSTSVPTPTRAAPRSYRSRAMIGIGIDLAEVMGHVLIAPVTDFYIEMVHTTFDPDPLMEGVATPLATLAIKQTDFVFWPPPTMIDPVPQVIGMALQAIAGHIWSPRGKRSLNRCCRSGSQPFIGVEAEHPLMGSVA